MISIPKAVIQSVYLFLFSQIFHGPPAAFCVPGLKTLDLAVSFKMIFQLHL